MDFETRPTKKRSRHSRVLTAFILALAMIAGLYISNATYKPADPQPVIVPNTPLIAASNEALLKNYATATAGLEALAIKGRAPKTGYTRTQFGNGWQESGGCDTRNRILARDLTNIVYKINSCIVETGTLQDFYTGKQINFSRGAQTSAAVQIDHVVALSDAWQKGAQQLSPALRETLANDSLELLAVDGTANQNKGDGDAATWLPPNKDFRCTYVARQISVKLKYSLWVTSAEKQSMHKILNECPTQPLVM